MHKRLKRLYDIANALRPVKQTYRCFHVAFVMDKNKVLSIGHNENKTHPKILQYNYKSAEARLHAEMAAILKIRNKDLSRYTLVILRVNQDGKLMNSRPCSGCMQMIVEHGFRHITYSTTNEGIVSEKITPETE